VGKSTSAGIKRDITQFLKKKEEGERIDWFRALMRQGNKTEKITPP